MWARCKREKKNLTPFQLGLSCKILSFFFFLLQLKKSACRLCIFEESSRCGLILGIFLFESVTFFLIPAESCDFLCSGKRELSVPFSQNLTFKDTEVWITQLCETVLHIFSQTYALFRKMPPRSLITLRSDESDARRPSWIHAKSWVCGSSCYPVAVAAFTRAVFPILLPPPQDPLRFDSYYISQIRSSLRWHNSSWWLDLG